MKQAFKYLLLLATVWTLGYIPGMAQQDAEAKRILDRMSRTIKQAKGIEIHFTLTNYLHGTPQSSMQGNICLQADKFRLTTQDMITWFDGNTQWSYLTINEEVNISTPEKEELQTINPLAIIGLYKQGYHYQLERTTEKTYEIVLTAEKEDKQLSDLTLYVDCKTFLPHSVKVREAGKGYNLITIDQLKTGMNWKTDFFTFDKQQYPHAEVIDLR